MKDEKFRKIDDSVSEGMKNFPVRRIPQEILKNFSSDVAQKIRERENQRIRAAEKRPLFWFQAVVPAMAVFLLFFAVVFRFPSIKMTSALIPLVSMSTSEITEEIAAMKALGVWNDEDDKAVLSDESALEEIEIA